MRRLLVLLIGLCASLQGFPQKIITFAGTHVAGYSGDGGPANMAMFDTPSGVAADSLGDIYIADQNGSRIRMVKSSGIVMTVAGGGPGVGLTGDGGPATAASLNWPEGVALDKNLNIYIADQFNEAIRKVDHNTGIISTIAGGTIGYSGDGGPATLAALWHPADVAVDGNGNVYFVDQDNSAVRKISTAGIISTIAGNGTAGYGGDGGPATAGLLNFPQGIACDKWGNIYVADFLNNRVRKISGSGVITTIAGTGTAGYSGDGGPATAAKIYNASAVAVDIRGNLYLSDYYSSVVRKVDTSGMITTIAGNDTAGYSGDCGPATAASIYWPEGIAADIHGNVYIADFNNYCVREITDSPVCLPTIINSKVAKPAIKVYPNPTDGKIVIEMPYACSFVVTVWAETGRQVACFRPAVSSKDNFDLSKLPNSGYYIKIVSDEFTTVERLIINH